MVNMASGIARGGVLSPTVVVVVAAVNTTSRKHGDLSHAFLVRLHKGSHQVNDIGYSCQLIAVKTRKLLTSVT